MQRSKEEFIKLIERFIADNSLAVLATVKPNGEPEAACVEFVVLDNLNLGFCTQISYRKYKYLRNTPQIAIVFGGQNNITVQYEGAAIEVNGESDVSLAIKARFGSDFASLVEARFFRISPTWAHYSDFKDNQQANFEIQEMTF